MKKLRNIRLDNQASNYVMSWLLGVDENYYSKLEVMGDKNVPPAILDKIDNLLDVEKTISDFYTEQERFYIDRGDDFMDILKDAGKTVEDAANETLLPVSAIQAAVDGEPFNNSEIKDKLIHYFRNLVNVDIPNNQFFDNFMSSFPESETPVEEIKTVEKDDNDLLNEISSLNIQVDWYESIIRSFTKLIDLVHKD